VVANDAFFQRPQAQAVLKHGILKRYATVFATMAGSATGRVTYFDGYAGPGKYGTEAPGSPLLIVQTAGRTAKWGRSVRCFFVEKDRNNAAALRELLRVQAPAELEYRVKQGDVADHVVAALDFAGDDPMLTFLDPFGAALDYDTLTKHLLARPSNLPTEVLLNLNLEMVGRIGGLLASTKPTAGRAATLARLDGFFGGRWWRETFHSMFVPGEDGSAAAAAWEVARAFLARVQNETRFRYFGVPVRRRPRHAPLFLLLLLYRNPIAPWKFNEQVSLANEEWRAFCWEANTDSLVADLSSHGDDLFGEHTERLLRESEQEAWEKEQTSLEGEWVQSIAENLRALLDRDGRIRLSQHIEEVYGGTIGLARDKHVNRAWDQLARDSVAAPRVKSSRLEYAIIERPPTS
jgi:three-Cys-motif partner protein